MNALAQVIGWAFLIAAIIGAIIPGMNFHVVFSDDQGAMEHHEEQAKELKEKLEKKK